MPNSNTLTSNITTSPHEYSVQTITPDYTGIYALCGIIFILAILLYAVIYKISEKWRLTYLQLGQEEIKKTCEQNIILLRKLDKVLDTLNKEIK